jgi:hypothetical protein
VPSPPNILHGGTASERPTPATSGIPELLLFGTPCKKVRPAAQEEGDHPRLCASHSRAKSTARL